MRRRQFVTGISLSVLASGALRAEPARHLVMASLVSNTESFAARWLSLIYTDAFQQLGVGLEIRAFPAARAAAEAAAGNVDGELARSYEYEATQTALMRVPEPTFFARTIAFAQRPDIQLAPGWESLRGTPYHVEYRLGYPVIAQKLAAVLPAGQLSEVRNAETGLRKLVLGRSDLYVDFADIVEAQLERAEFRNAGIRAATLLERGPVHAYLNRKHADLAPRLAAILKKMRDSGQIERYRQQALHQN